MDHSVEISVIIPVYNTEKYLKQCLDSAISSIGDQTLKVQIVLVDDGSTDRCAEICDFYAARYPFVQCIHQKNSGVSIARNVGLKVAVGEYIAWIDSDDYVSPDWFSRILDGIARVNPDVIVFDSLRVGLDKNIPEIYGRPEGSIALEMLLDDIARDIRMLSGLPNKVIRKVCYRDIIFGQETILEDYKRIFQILAEAKTAYYIPQMLYYYRQQESSIIHSSTPEQSFFCVNAALDRKEALFPRFQSAATVGVGVQMVRFCRARGYDVRYLSWNREYSFCMSYVRKNIWRLLFDAETPGIWKFKFCLLGVGLLPVSVKIKLWRENEE